MAGRVITIAQQKGGAGKTTLAAHLALAWASAGRRVAAVDIDPQGSLSQWFRLRLERLGAEAGGLEVATVNGWRASAEIARLARGHDLVLVDSPPHAETDAKTAIRAAHLVVTPVQPSPLDLWATKATVELARAERRPLLIVLNRVPSGRALPSGTLEAAAAMGAEVAQARLGNRASLSTSMAEGRWVAETAPGTVAAREVAKLAREILARAGG